MFDLNKKKDDPIAWQKKFQSSFSTEQKAAIILSMGFVAKCDGQYHPKELDLIKQIAIHIGINLEKEMMPGGIININASKGIEYFGKVLNNLESGQKEWYLVSLFNLIHCDGNVAEAEAKEVLMIAEDIDISAEQYKQIVDKWDKLYELFFQS